LKSYTNPLPLTLIREDKLKRRSTKNHAKCLTFTFLPTQFCQRVQFALENFFSQSPSQFKKISSVTRRWALIKLKEQKRSEGRGPSINAGSRVNQPNFLPQGGNLFVIRCQDLAISTCTSQIYPGNGFNRWA